MQVRKWPLVVALKPEAFVWFSFVGIQRIGILYLGTLKPKNHRPKY